MVLLLWVSGAVWWVGRGAIQLTTLIFFLFADCMHTIAEIHVIKCTVGYLVLVLHRLSSSTCVPKPKKYELLGRKRQWEKKVTSGFYIDHFASTSKGFDSPSESAINSSPAMAGKRKRPGSSLTASPGPSKVLKSSSRSSTRLQDQIAEEDARIAQLEKKLGIKKGRKSIPTAFKEDGLDDLLGDLGDERAEESFAKSQSKSEYDEWLARKRGLVQDPVDRIDQADSPDDDVYGSSEDGDDTDNDHGSYGEDGEEEEFEGFEDEESVHSRKDIGDEVQPRRIRENPYIAPVPDTASAGKYVPPSLRKPVSADDTGPLRRQLQGLLNRLTESNMPAILKDIEKVYASNPRGQVTSVLVDAIMSQISNTATLSDTFFILQGGFVAGLYRIIGESFASHVVTRVVEDFREEYSRAAKLPVADVAQPLPKESSNLVTFLAELYVFQVVSCGLIFDLVRLFLDELSELNTELLLRIVRMAGKLLRRDDPQALKDVAGRLQSLLAAADQKRVTERTRFMVDTIADLKNNKMRAGLQESAIVTNHVTTMRKLLGNLNSKRSTSSGPLRIGLRDIDESATKGKWWLVGASFAGNSGADQTKQDPRDETADADSSSDDEDLDRFFPDYIKVAKEQGLKTDTQHAIFAAIAGASDHNDAVIRFQKLNLNKNQRREVVFVLIQAAGAEQPYNPYYTLIARKLSSDGRIRFAFQDRLWQIFRRLGESVFEDEGDEEEDDTAVGLEDARMANIGRMMGSLVASSALSIKILKCLDLTNMKKKTSLLLEHMMFAVFRECGKRDKGKGNADLERCFKDAATSPILAAGLHYYLGKLGKAVDKRGRAKKSEIPKIKDSCKLARQILKTHATAEDGEGEI